MTYCVHGEPSAAAALRDAIERELGWRWPLSPPTGQQIDL